MKFGIPFAAAALLLLAGPAPAQSEDSSIDSIHFDLLERLYAQSGVQMQQRLVALGIPAKRAENIVFDLYDDAALCTASVAQATSARENVPVGYVLDLIEQKMCRLGDWRQQFGFDTRELYRDAAECQKDFSRNLRAALPPENTGSD